MKLEDMFSAINDAETALRHAEQCVPKMARLCVGRLRSTAVSDYTLKQLKKELQSYNMHTGRWKDE
jgi:hypothetical protein